MVKEVFGQLKCSSSRPQSKDSVQPSPSLPYATHHFTDGTCTHPGVQGRYLGVIREFTFPLSPLPTPIRPEQALLGLQANSLYIPLPQASPMHQGHCSQSLLDPWLLLLPSCIPSSSRLAKPFENLSQITSLSYLKPIRASCCSQSTNHALGRGCDLAAASQAPSPAALTTHFLSPPLKPWNIPHTLWQLHGSFSAWQFLLRKTFLNHPF